jgi:hypothetical protein
MAAIPSGKRNGNTSNVFYSVHENFSTKVFIVQYIIKHNLLSATSQFDGK